MDMTGVELLVANAHHQVQCVEDEVLHAFMVDNWQAQQDHCILEEALRDRVHTKEEWMTWMEEHFGNLLHFVNHREDNEEAFKEVLNAQAVTIIALKDRVGELELGHCLLCDRIIVIEVRMLMVAFNL